MLGEIADLYPAVTPLPSDALITQRRESIGEFIKGFDKPGLLFATVELAAFGFPAGAGSQVRVAAEVLTKAIQAQQPSFTSDLNSNALDLQICACIALGEHFTQIAKKPTWQGDAAAALLVSALQTRPVVAEAHLQKVLNRIVEAARLALDTDAINERRITDVGLSEIDGADIATLTKSCNAAVKELNEALEQTSRVSREELNILWWMFGGRSTTLSQPFNELEPGCRVVAAAIELAQLTLLPPAPTAPQFLFRILEHDSKLTIRQLIQSCPEPLLKSAICPKQALDVVVKEHPSLMPLTWLCVRRIDSGGASGWENEFELKTHIGVKQQRRASEWAIQLFNEAIAARLIVAAGS